MMPDGVVGLLKVSACALAVVASLSVTPAHEANAASPSCFEPSPWAYLSLTSSESSSGLCSVLLSDTAPITIVGITVRNALEFQKVRFSLSTPATIQIAAITWLQPFVGDLETGIEFDLGSCQTGPITLATMVVINPNFPQPVACADWLFGPHSGTGAMEAIDCDGNVKRALGGYHQVFTGMDGGCGCSVVEECFNLPLTQLLPPDGATEVPTDVVMTWDPVPPLSAIIVRIGTDPDCADFATFNLFDVTMFTPDFLTDNTTYYWQVGWLTSAFCSSWSDVQSFTTAATVPTENASWGSIKALFE